MNAVASFPRIASVLPSVAHNAHAANVAERAHITAVDAAYNAR